MAEQQVTSGTEASAPDPIFGQLNPSPFEAPAEPEAEASAEGEEAAVEEPEAEAEETAETKPEAKTQVKAKTQSVEELAKLLGLDPKDKAKLDILKQFAQADKQEQPEPELDFAALRAEIFGEPKVEPETAKKDAEQPRQQNANEPFRFNDIGASWNNVEDAYKMRQEADLAGEHRRVAEVDQAIFDRRVLSLKPGLEELAERIASKVIENKLRDYMPEIQHTRQERIETSGRNKAEKLLRAHKTFGPIFAELLKEDGGEPVVIDGDVMDAIPFNRIVQAYPHIGKIVESHGNPEEAAFRTWTEKFMAALAIHTRDRTANNRASKAAKVMAEAGAKAGARTERAKALAATGSGGRTNGKMQTEGDGKPDLTKWAQEHSPGWGARQLLGS